MRRNDGRGEAAAFAARRGALRELWLTGFGLASQGCRELGHWVWASALSGFMQGFQVVASGCWMHLTGFRLEGFTISTSLEAQQSYLAGFGFRGFGFVGGRGRVLDKIGPNRR